MSVAGLQSSLTTELGSITPPYTQSDIRDRIARAIHAGVGTVVTFAATHGVQALVPTPGGTARGFQVLEAYDSLGNPMSVIGSPKIDRTVGGGNVGITVQFETPPLVMTAARLAAQSIPNKASTAIAYDNAFNTAYYVNGGANPISVNLSTGRITVAKAGVVQICAGIHYAGSATGSREFWINRTSDASRWGDTIFNPAVAADFVSECCATLTANVDFAAGDSFDVLTYQNSGGALNITNNVAYQNTVSARYVSPVLATAGTVRGILWDG